MQKTAEESRLLEARERHWGTVREDCSDSGDAWDYFTISLRRL